MFGAFFLSAHKGLTVSITHEIIVGAVSTVTATAVAGTLFAALKHTIAQVHHEVVPNSGSSMRDAIDRIEARQVQQGVELAKVGQQLADHLETATEDHVSLRAHIEAHE